MSSMLEQAIVDATALREAALKNAEAAIIEKYAPEIKNAVDSLLEQDDDMGLPDGLDIDDLEADLREQEEARGSGGRRPRVRIPTEESLRNALEYLQEVGILIA